MKKEKTCNCSQKTKKRKGNKTKASLKRKKDKNKERHGDAFYFTCFAATTMFVSRMKKASSLIQQANRIERFVQIINNKREKVKIKSDYNLLNLPFNNEFQNGDFNQTLSSLISALGGNLSNPRCSTPGIDYQGRNIEI